MIICLADTLFLEFQLSLWMQVDAGAYLREKVIESKDLFHSPIRKR